MIPFLDLFRIPTCPSPTFSSSQRLARIPSSVPPPTTFHPCNFEVNVRYVILSINTLISIFLNKDSFYFLSELLMLYFAVKRKRKEKNSSISDVKV